MDMEAQGNNYIVKSGNEMVMTNGIDMFWLSEDTNISGDIKPFTTTDEKKAAEIATIFGGEIVRR